MCARDLLEAVSVAECLADVLAEGEAGAARTDVIAAAVVRVAPEQVAHAALVGDLLLAVERTDVVERLHLWTEAAVQTEDAVLDHGGERQEVEEVGEALPDRAGAVLAQTLVVEAVDLRDLPRLVVAAQDHDTPRVAHLQQQQQRDALHRLVAAVHVVAQKQVVGVRTEPASCKQAYRS